MSRLTDLVRQVAAADPQLASDLEREIKALGDRRAFGLNFERHTPETVELHNAAIRRGSKVRFLPLRGESAGSVDARIWVVASIDRVGNEPIAALVRRDVAGAEVETATRTVADLVVVAEFRDPIYPGLVSTGKVERGGDKPFHSVINAENFHALEALLYTHEGKVDAIYIDPPYNTGAKDWKYNNDYVDGDDLYRHSKWLAFMERRLKLAKRLLNPDNSVLIVTIDEKEYLRLGLLLQQAFPEASTQLVTTVTNQRGVARGRGFARVDEYAFFVFVGQASVAQWQDDMLTSEATAARQRIDIWSRLMRRGTDSRREDSPRQFYPVFIDPATKAIVSVGEPLAPDASRRGVTAPDGLVAVWPLRTNGAEGRWTLGAETLRRYASEGLAKVGMYNKSRDSWSLSYLIAKDIRRIESGELEVLGRDANGVLELAVSDAVERRKIPRTVWLRDAHNAGTYGSDLLGRLVPRRRFPFPKSLYLVEDALRFFVADKPEAVVVDFFAGSGTTCHAVMRLNKQDGGRRQCISVTNNEVSADEQAGLRSQKLRPGDPEWEQWGICDYITKPRIAAAVTGLTPDGEPIKGDYKFTDEFPMSDGFEENVEFFTMTYEAPRQVAHHRSFAAIAPLLWLRAGAEGSRIDEPTDDFAIAEVYGVLFDMDASHEFIEAVTPAPRVRMAFVVTNDERAYQMVCSDLPNHVKPIRLYESYLASFAVNASRD